MVKETQTCPSVLSFLTVRDEGRMEGEREREREGGGGWMKKVMLQAVCTCICLCLGHSRKGETRLLQKHTRGFGKHVRELNFV